MGCLDGMTTQSRVPSFSREDLELPVTWRSLSEVHIPLSYAVRKMGVQLVVQLAAFMAGAFVLILVMEGTFRPAMHAMKPYLADVDLRMDIYVAMVVVGLWLFSRICFKKRLHRLQCLLHLIPATAMASTYVLSFG